MLSFIDFKIFTSVAHTLSVLENFVKVQILVVESWSCYVNAQNALIKTLIWNDTSNIWHRPSSLAFEAFEEYISDSLIANFTASVEYDLGNYTSQYKAIMTTIPSCGRLFLRDELSYFCSFAVSGGLNSPFITSLRHIAQTQKTTYEKWKISRNSFESSIGLLYDSEFRHEIAFIDIVTFEWYYNMGQDIGVYVLEQVNQAYTAIEMFGNWTYSLIAIISFLAAILISITVKDSFKDVLSIIKLVPERFIYEKVQLMNKLRDL